VEGLYTHIRRIYIDRVLSIFLNYFSVRFVVVVALIDVIVIFFFSVVALVTEQSSSGYCCGLRISIFCCKKNRNDGGGGGDVDLVTSFPISRTRVERASGRMFGIETRRSGVVVRDFARLLRSAVRDGVKFDGRGMF
jgi:hypothetical protein